MVSLKHLPREVLGLIIDLVETSDFYSLRLVAKEINKNCFQKFAVEFFETLETDLSSRRIDKLRKISEQYNLTPHVHTLLFKDKDQYSRSHSLNNWNDSAAAHSTLRSERVERFCDLLVSKFKSCRSFRIEGRVTSTDTVKHNRFDSSDAVATVLALVARTGLLINSFSMNLSPGTGKIDITKLDTPLYSKPEFRTPWAYLRDLSLVFTIDREALDWTLDLIICAKGLQRLALGLDTHESEAFFQRLAAVGGLPRLEELKITNSCISKETLLTLLLHFTRSLRTLVLRAVNFESGSWSLAFLEMRHVVSGLHDFQVFSLYDSAGQVIFPTLRHSPELLSTEGLELELANEKIEMEPQVTGIHYRGEHITNALDILAGSSAYYRISPPSDLEMPNLLYPSPLTDRTRSQQFIVLYDFDAQNTEELSVKRNEDIVVIQKEGNGKLDPEA